MRIEKARQAAVTNSMGKRRGMGRGSNSRGPHKSTAPKPDLVGSVEASDGIDGMVACPVLVAKLLVG